MSSSPESSADHKLEADEQNKLRERLESSRSVLSLAKDRLVAVFSLNTRAAIFHERLDDKTRDKRLEKWSAGHQLGGVLRTLQDANVGVLLGVPTPMGNIPEISTQGEKALVHSMVLRLRAAAIISEIAVQVGQLANLSIITLPCSQDGTADHTKVLSLDLVRTRLEDLEAALSKLPISHPKRFFNSRAVEHVNMGIIRLLGEAKKLSAQLDDGIITWTVQNLKEVVEHTSFPPAEPGLDSRAQEYLVRLDSRAKEYIVRLGKDQKRATDLMNPSLSPQNRAELEEAHPPTIFMWYFLPSLALMVLAGYEEDSQGLTLEHLGKWKIEFEDL